MIMGANACDDVFGWAERDPGRAIFAAQADGGWQPVTAAQFASQVGAVAAGLIASQIRTGDRVGLMAPTSLEWAVCDFAIWAAAAVTVPIYETSSVEQIEWELRDSGAVAVFAGTARLAEAIHRTQPAKVEAI
jgi:long-chain acyl-CoA synthetase